MMRTAILAVTATSVLTVVMAATAGAEEIVSPGMTTLQLFEHDTQQTPLDLGAPGPGPGDQLLFVGDVFDRPGGAQLGHIAGQCTRLSGDATTGDVTCTMTFVLSAGEITIHALGDEAAILRRGETIPIAIIGGTGSYAGARGDGTLQIPNQTDGNVVLNVMTG